jgi:hypothetical protein
MWDDMINAEVHFFDTLEEAVAFSENKIVRITKAYD